MKLVIATAAAALLGISAAIPAEALAQDAAETPESPDLRGDADSESADADADAVAAVDPAANATAAAAAADPAAQLAQARAAALSAAAVPGETADPLLANVVDYALFQRDLAAIQTREIAEPEDLDGVMDTLAGYNPETLAHAFLAYGAFIGAQHGPFVEKVREVSEYYGVDQLVQGMLNEPEYVLTFEGAREAAASVLRVVREDVAQLAEMSDQFKQTSYDLQNRGWSNLIAQDRLERQTALTTPSRLSSPSDEMLALVAYGVPSGAVDAAATPQMRRAVFWSAVDYRADPQVTPGAGDARVEAEAIGVMMTLAALRTLEVSETRPDLVEHLLTLPTAEDCLDFSLLHMRQCVSAAHFKYEDAFCIAEHQLKDMGECLAEIVDPRAPRAPLPSTIQASADPAIQASTDAAVAAEVVADPQSAAN